MFGFPVFDYSFDKNIFRTSEFPWIGSIWLELKENK
jgi:hypothetical protein